MSRQALVSIGRKNLRVVVADSDEDKRIGLSRHSSLGHEEGMLFPYGVPASVTFHMSTVPFPIDMVFLRRGSQDGDYRIARVVHNLQPGDDDFYHHADTAAVLEMAGGFCRTCRLGVGDAVKVQEIEAETRPQWTPDTYYHGVGPDTNDGPWGMPYVDRDLAHYPGMGGGYADRRHRRPPLAPNHRMRQRSDGGCTKPIRRLSGEPNSYWKKGQKLK